jgi:hypothetical protein
VGNVYPRGDPIPDDVRSWQFCRRLESHVIAVLTVSLENRETTRETSFLLNQYAMHLHARADFAAAEPLYRRAIAIDEVNFGSDHVELAGDLNNLASLLVETNRPSEAEPLMRRVADIVEKSLE